MEYSTTLMSSSPFLSPNSLISTNPKESKCKTVPKTPEKSLNLGTIRKCCPKITVSRAFSNRLKKLSPMSISPYPEILTRGFPSRDRPPHKTSFHTGYWLREHAVRGPDNAREDQWETKIRVRVAVQFPGDRFQKMIVYIKEQENIIN